MTGPAMPKDLEHTIDAAICDSLLAQRPSLVDTISDMLAQGQTPEQIERRAANMLRAQGRPTDLAREIWHAARHLERIG